MEEFKNLALVEKDEYEILPNGWFENLNNVSFYGMEKLSRTN